MYIAMNRFKVKEGFEEAFENVWKSRESSLEDNPGFVSFNLLRGAFHEDEGYTLFASHTHWETEADFIAWTKSQSFRDAHKNAGQNKVHYIGHPNFEGFNRVEGA
ncbi:MAG: antibiotic biosynthesis monooxygenase [Pseudomonadota bacterium]